jgi:Tfp pilus assembly protein PilV
VEKRGDRIGLSVGEVVVAIGLLGVVVVFVLAVFTKLMASSTKSSSQTIGLLLAQRRMDQAMRSGPPGWGGNPPVSTTEDLPLYEENQSQSTHVYQHDEMNGIEYWQHFKAERIQRKTMGDLWRLTVDVVWWPSDVAAPIKSTDNVRQGQGRLSLTLSRAYYHQFVKP